MGEIAYPEEHELGELGLRSRVVAPLQLGARAIGALAVVRSAASSFSQEEVDLLTLLGRFVATSVQNIRAYEAEHRTVEELRRLSTLRADFVSMVSHELRSPMAAVIGASRTLEQRWRELSPEQRSSFLSLIAGETTRLASLIGDVLDTSRIEAGTFSYSFGELDLGELVLDSASAAQLGHDEVRVEAKVATTLPSVHGDRERLRQVLVNLIDNAVKYSPTGETVTLAASAENGVVQIDVRDRGPGIAAEDQKVIFEKFGRLHAGGGGKPGTGLGLFIARSIAEAHGGTLTVRSSPGRGATFRLALPAGA
jgi:signal transduction histidine kinase